MKWLYVLALTGNSCDILTGIPLPSANSNCPEQSEYIDGVPQAIASIRGKFQPSALAQETNTLQDFNNLIYSSLGGKWRILILSSSSP